MDVQKCMFEKHLCLQKEKTSASTYKAVSIIKKLQYFRDTRFKENNIVWKLDLLIFLFQEEILLVN